MAIEDEQSQGAGQALARTLSRLHQVNAPTQVGGNREGLGTRSVTSCPVQHDKATSRHRAGQEEQIDIKARYGEPAVDVPQFQFYSSEAPYIAGYLIHPLSRLKVYWDVCVFLMLMFCMFVYSFRLALVSPDSYGWFVTNRLVNLFWLCDIFVQCNTAIREYDVLIDDRTEILRRYLRTWFLPDLVAAIPVDLIFADILIANIVPLPRILETIHIFRFYKIGRVIRGFTVSLRLRHVTERVMKLGVIAVFIAHINACGFTLVAVIEHHLGEINWISDQGIRLDDVYNLYAVSLYWSMSTVTTIGYGDIVSVSTVERVFNIFSVIVGAGGFAFIITSLVGYIGRVPKKDEQFNDKLDSVNAYIKFRKIPSTLAERIRRFHILAFHGSIHELRHEKEIINELPQSLKNRFAIHVARQLCTWSTFFFGAEPNFSLDLLMAMEEKYLPTGETVVFQGEYCGEVYIIEEGRVEAIFDGGRIAHDLSKGQYFGMDGLISETKVHILTYRALSWVKLRALRVEDLLEIVWKYPSTRNIFFAKENKLPSQDVCATPRSSIQGNNAQSAIQQLPILTFLVRHRKQIENRIMSRYMFRPGNELGESSTSKDLSEGSIDLAAVQESILQLDLALCNELADKLRNRLRQLDTQSREADAA